MMKKMMLVAGIISALMINVATANACSAAEVSKASYKTTNSYRGKSMLGNKNLNPVDLFQIKDAATCLEDILGGEDKK